MLYKTRKYYLTFFKLHLLPVSCWSLQCGAADCTQVRGGADRNLSGRRFLPSLRCSAQLESSSVSGSLGSSSQPRPADKHTFKLLVYLQEISVTQATKGGVSVRPEAEQQQAEPVSPCRKNSEHHDDQSVGRVVALIFSRMLTDRENNYCMFVWSVCFDVWADICPSCSGWDQDFASGAALHDTAPHTLHTLTHTHTRPLDKKTFSAFSSPASALTKSHICNHSLEQLKFERFAAF